MQAQILQQTKLRIINFFSGRYVRNSCLCNCIRRAQVISTFLPYTPSCNKEQGTSSRVDYFYTNPAQTMIHVPHKLKVLLIPLATLPNFRISDGPLMYATPDTKRCDVTASHSQGAHPTVSFLFFIQYLPHPSIPKSEIVLTFLFLEIAQITIEDFSIYRQDLLSPTDKAFQNIHTLHKALRL